MATAPKFLYRFFDKEEFALNFLDYGKLLMRTHRYYAEIEDESRKDASEGIAIFTVKSEIQNWEEINRSYILCTSSPDVDLEYAKEKFGHFVVKICDPELLCRDLQSADVIKISDRERLRKDLQSAEHPFQVQSCCLKEVSYSQGKERDVDVDNYCNADSFSSWQKAKRYEAECEYRYILRTNIYSSTPCNSFIDIKLKSTPKYLKRLWR